MNVKILENKERMNENKDYEDYSEDEIKSIIDYLTRFSKGHVNRL